MYFDYSALTQWEILDICEVSPERAKVILEKTAELMGAPVKPQPLSEVLIPMTPFLLKFTIISCNEPFNVHKLISGELKEDKKFLPSRAPTSQNTLSEYTTNCDELTMMQSFICKDEAGIDEEVLEKAVVAEMYDITELLYKIVNHLSMT